MKWDKSQYILTGNSALSVLLSVLHLQSFAGKEVLLLDFMWSPRSYRPHLPSVKIGEGPLPRFYWGEGEGVCTQATYTVWGKSATSPITRDRLPYYIKFRDVFISRF